MARSPQFELDRDALTDDERQDLIDTAANNMAWLLQRDIRIVARTSQKIPGERALVSACLAQDAVNPYRDSETA